MITANLLWIKKDFLTLPRDNLLFWDFQSESSRSRMHSDWGGLKIWIKLIRIECRGLIQIGLELFSADWHRANLQTFFRIGLSKRGIGWNRMESSPEPKIKKINELKFQNFSRLKNITISKEQFFNFNIKISSVSLVYFTSRNFILFRLIRTNQKRFLQFILMKIGSKSNLNRKSVWFD